MADLTIEDIAEMRFIADAAAASGFERILVDPKHVIALIDELNAQEAARDKNANEHLDLICRLHTLADEYAGPRPIDATPESDLEAIEDGIAGAQSERDEYRRAKVIAEATAIAVQAQLDAVSEVLGADRLAASDGYRDAAVRALLAERHVLRLGLARQHTTSQGFVRCEHATCLATIDFVLIVDSDWRADARGWWFCPAHSAESTEEVRMPHPV